MSHRDKAIELVEDGFITYEQLATMALKYMSEDDVRDMCHVNEIELFLDEEDD